MTLVGKNPFVRKQKRQKRKEAEIASQWQLMYWKFIKHKLALIALPIVTILIILALFSEFFAPTLPALRHENYMQAQPNGLRLICVDGNFYLRPFVHGIERHTDPATFQRVYLPISGVRHEMGFFVRGPEYMMWGIIPGTLRFFGPVEAGAPFFPMGTDQLGRCLFTRIIHGTRVSMSFAFLSVFFTFILGLTLGGLSGYLGGIIDMIIQRTIDLVRSIPQIPLWMALAAALPRGWDPLMIYFGMVVIMSLVGWTDLARVVRGKILSIREEDFTMAARLCGASDARIILKHMLPSFASFIIVVVTMSIPASVLGETALSFLGLGLQPPVVSWGVLLQDAQTVQALALQPWLLWPVAFVIITVLAFNFLGDGLRDAADPYAR